MESVKILDYPFIVLLEALIDSGWKIIVNQAEDEPEAHDKSTAKFMSGKNIFNRKEFIACLHNLDKLIGRGLTALKGNQCKAYYVQILEAKKPNEVRLDQPKDFYNQDDFNEGEEEEAVVDEPIEEQPVEQPEIQTEDAQNSKASHKKKRIDSSSLEDLLNVLATTTEIKDYFINETEDHDKKKRRNSGSAGSSGIGHGEIGRRIDAVPEIGKSVFDYGLPFPMERNFHYPLLNSYITLNVIDDDPANLTVDFMGVCPLASNKHPRTSNCDCRKKRRFSANHCKHFGYYEPLAFLGAWIEHCSEYKGRDDHVRFNPSLEDVESFIDRFNWPKRAISKEDFIQKRV